MRKAAIIFLATALLSACKSDHDEPEGEVIFSFSTEATDGRLVTDQRPASIHLEVKNQDYEPSTHQVVVHQYDGNLISGGIHLPSGSYTLERFMVLDVNQEIIYLIPLSGSELAEFVNTPLPTPFNVAAGEHHEVFLQVLSVEGTEPGEFGYGSFEIKPLHIREIPVHVSLLNEVSAGELDYTLHVKALDTLTPAQTWTKTFELSSPGTVKLPIGYDQYAITVSVPKALSQTKYFRGDYPYSDLATIGSLDFELIPENTEHVITLESDGFRFHISKDPCKLWARMEVPENRAFELDYINYFTIGQDADGNYLGSPFPGGGLVDPPLLFANYNNLFDDSNFFAAPSYCELYLDESYRDRLAEVTFKKVLLLDFEYTGNESAAEDYDVHLIHVY